MKATKISMLISIAFVLCSCTGSKIISSWNLAKSSRQYNKIMVIGIIKDTSIALRKKMEAHLVDDLKAIGCSTVSALQEFGEGGLAGLEQEETYIKLCNKGIDAVITIALIDHKKGKFYVPATVKYYSNLYYYNRIWNYNTIQADLTAMKGQYEESTQFSWESILFDLQTLSPVYTAHTKSFDPASTEIMAHEYGKMIVENMVKRKVIQRKQPQVSQPLKAF
jgi:hypothetical protein